TTKGQSVFNVLTNNSKVTINAGAGTNQFILGLNGSVKGVQDVVAINGSGATSGLLVDDSQATSQDKVTVDSAHVDKIFGNGGSLVYNKVGKLVLNLSNAFDDTVALAASLGTTFTVNGNKVPFHLGHGALLSVTGAPPGTNTPDTAHPGS